VVVGPAAVLGVDGGGGRPDEPRVDRDAGVGGGLLDADLEVLGEPQADPYGRVVLAGRGWWLRRCGGRCLGAGGLRHVVGDPSVRQGRGDDEARFPVAQTQLDGAGRQIAGDLGGGFGEGVQQAEPQRGVERGGEPLGHLSRFVATGGSGDGELVLDGVDIGAKFHDAIMASP
jgi:hypothetical protein